MFIELLTGENLPNMRNKRMHTETQKTIICGIEEWQHAVHF